MADDDLMWRTEKDLRPRTPEDVKDAPYAWPGEKVFVPGELRYYNDDNRTPMSARERGELHLHGFVTGALRRTICAPPTIIDTGFSEPFELKHSPRWCDGDCKQCRHGETIPNSMRSNWNDEWHASIGWEEHARTRREDAAMAALGLVNDLLLKHGLTLVCARALRDAEIGRHTGCSGTNCRGFVVIPLGEYDRRRRGEDAAEVDEIKAWFFAQQLGVVES